MLGDTVETALASLGITPERVGRLLGGAGCNGCAERKARLNALDLWARRVLAGRVAGAREYLERILRWDDPD